MARAKRTALFLLGVASAFGVVWLIRKRRADTPGLSDWQDTLSRRYGAEKAHHLTTAVRRQHASLVNETSLPENKALRWHLTEKILPGLALYRVLLKVHAGDQTAALASVDEAFRAWTLAKNRLLLAPLRIFPAPFKLFKLAFAQMMKKFPFEGWDFTYIENNDHQVAFNATRCFYLNNLTALGAPELTASFCKSDEVMAELFPPSIRFVRRHTLGRGDDVCDFQYCRVKQS